METDTAITLPKLKLPRQVEADPRHAKVAELLDRDLKPLWEKSTLQVATLVFTPALEKALLASLRYQQLERGLESIDKMLDMEQKGLLALQKKQGTTPALRVSRLLLVATDGSERFYRSCGSTLIRHSDRVLLLKIEISSDRLGLILFGPGKPVKALLVAEKEAVSGVLLGLAGAKG